MSLIVGYVITAQLCTLCNTTRI